MPDRRSNESMAGTPSGRDPRLRAGVVLSASRELRSALGEQVTGDGHLTILLYVFSQDGGRGVTTAACCAAVDAPRTTALRWIRTLVDLDIIKQRTDEEDRRVTLLHLCETAVPALERWLLAIADG